MLWTKQRKQEESWYWSWRGGVTLDTGSADWGPVHAFWLSRDCLRLQWLYHVITELSAWFNWDWLSFHEGIKFPSVWLDNYFLACSHRPNCTCGFSCMPLLALTWLASVLQSGSQGGSDSIFFRLLDEARLSVTDTHHFMLYLQVGILGDLKNQAVGSQGSLWGRGQFQP